MEFKNLTINFLGDSITQGVGVSKPENVFPARIAAKTGAICRNYGISGTRIARQRVPSQDRSFDLDFCSRVEEMDPHADLVLVFGGTNDYGHGDAPFGTPADQTEDTFCGALNVLYSKLAARFPAARIVILTPLHRTDEDGRYKDSPDGKKRYVLRDYVEQIRRCAAEYGFPVLDLYATSALRPAQKAVREQYVPDGLHPNDGGHQILSEQIIQFLSSLSANGQTDG